MTREAVRSSLAPRSPAPPPAPSLEIARARRALGAVAVAFVLVAFVIGDAAVRRRLRGRDGDALRAVGRLLPSSDLALSGGARWLRAPSMEEPGAAFADAPALPDPDPAGGIMAPPRSVWAEEVRREPAGAP